MKVNIAIEIPDAVMLSKLKGKGYKPSTQDLGRWENNHHNRAVWREDVCMAFYIDNQYYDLKTAFEMVFKYELQKMINQILTK